MTPVQQQIIHGALQWLLNRSSPEGQSFNLLRAMSFWLHDEAKDLRAITDAMEVAAKAKGAARSAADVALLGFICANSVYRVRYQASFKKQLHWLMGLPNFITGGEPSSIVTDPIKLLGVCVGADSCLSANDRTSFGAWLHNVCADGLPQVRPGDWRIALIPLVQQRFALPPSIVPSEDWLWLHAALTEKGWAIVREDEVGAVLRSASSDAHQVTDGFEACLRHRALLWSIQRVLAYDIGAMSVQGVIDVLRNVPSVFQRWTWEDKARKSGAVARTWNIDHEYHFQSLIYTILKPVLPQLKEEEYLASTGTYEPRADLCLLSLELVIEIKYWYASESTSKLINEISADLTLYLRPESPYKSMVAVIWDDLARTQEHDELRRGLDGLTGLKAVIILNRPSTWIVKPPKRARKK